MVSNEFRGHLVDLSALRGVRLWHWRQVVHFGSLFKMGIPGSDYRMNCFKAQSFHMQAVQALNDLFDPLDTAEDDAARADAISKE